MNQDVELRLRIREEGLEALSKSSKALRELTKLIESGAKGGKAFSDTLNTISRGNQALSKNLRGLDQALAGTTKRFDESAKGAERFNNSITGSVIKADLALAALSRLTSGLKEYAIQAPLIASQNQTLSVVTDTLARTNNLNADSVFGQVQAIKELGITTKQAFNTTNQLIVAQLDLGRATEIARIAQNAAVVGLTDSSEALNRLVFGTVTRQPEVLRRLGIIVSFEQEFNQAQRAVGRELSENEKRITAFNAVLRQGAKVMGAYEASMTTTAKKLGSLTRFVEEAQYAVGREFVPAFSDAVDISIEFAKWTERNSEFVGGLTKSVIALGAALAGAGLVAGLAKLLAIAGSAFATGGTSLAVLGGAAIAGTGAAAYLFSQDPTEYSINASLAELEKVRKNKEEVILKSFEAMKTASALEKIKLQNDIQTVVETEFNVEKALFREQLENQIRLFEIQRRDAEEARKKLELIQDKPIVTEDGRLIDSSIKSPEVAKLERIIAAGDKPKFQSFNIGLQELTPDRVFKDAERRRLGLSIDDGLYNPPTDETESVLQMKALAKEAKAAEDAVRKLEQSLLLTGADDGVAKVNQEFDTFLLNLKEGFAEHGGSIPKQLLERVAAARATAVGQELEKQAAKFQESREKAALEAQKLFTAAAEDTSERIQEAADSFLLTQKTLEGIADKIASQSLQRSNAIFKSNVAGIQQASGQALQGLSVSNNNPVAVASRSRDIRIQTALEIGRLSENQLQQEINATRVRLETADRLFAAEQANLEARIAGEQVISKLRYETQLDDAKEKLKVNPQDAGALEVIRLANLRYQLEDQSAQQREKLALAFGQDRLDITAKLASLEDEIGQNRLNTERAIQQERFDFEIRIAEFREQRAQEFGQLVGEAFDALTASGQGGFQAFLESQRKATQRKISQNFGTELFRSSNSSLALPGQVNEAADGTKSLTFLGKLLQGTPFGASPEALIEEENTNAIKRLTVSTDRLNAAMTGAALSQSVGKGVADAVTSTVPFLGGSLDQFKTPPFLPPGLFGGATPFSGDPGSVLASLPPDLRPGGKSAPVVLPNGQVTIPGEGKGVSNANKAAGVAYGAVGVYSGIKQGGTSGALNATSSGLAAIAPFTGPAAPYVAGAAIALQMIAPLFGANAKQDREEQIAKLLDDASFTGPEDKTYDLGLNNSTLGRNKYGQLREVGSFVEPVTRSSSSTGSTTIQMNVNAMDARSFIDRAPDIGAAVLRTMQDGTSPALNKQIIEVAIGPNA